MPARHGQAHPFFVNGAVDFALVGGLSLAIFVFYRFHPQTLPDVLLVSAGALTVALNWPHFAATSLRLYGSASSLRQYPVTAVAAPLLCTGAIAGALASPLVVAPLFLKVFLLWSPFHYSGQTIGITMIYARRRGLRMGSFTRTLLAGFVYLSFVSQTAASEVSPVGLLYSGVRLPNFGVPVWAPGILHQLMILSGICSLGLLAADCVRQRKFPPVMLFLPAVAQYVWFVPGANVPFYRELVPAFHSLQYLLIAWSMHLHETAASGGGPFTASEVVRRSAFWIAINLAVGWFLFWVLPQAVAAAGSNPALAAGVVVAGVQVHHFLVDGVIWKLKSGAVCSPLMLSIADLLEPSCRSPRPAAPEPAP